MIVSGGENVFPQEVEDCLSRHPLVVDVACIGVEDEEYGSASARLRRPRRAGSRHGGRAAVARQGQPRALQGPTRRRLRRRAAAQRHGQGPQTRAGRAMSPLPVGSQAPDFALRDQHGQTVTLSSYRGTKAVVLVFYPWAFSRVCGGELRALRDVLPAVPERRRRAARRLLRPHALPAGIRRGRRPPVPAVVRPLAARRCGVVVRRLQRGDRGSGPVHVRHRPGRPGGLGRPQRLPDARDLDRYREALAVLRN